MNRLSVAISLIMACAVVVTARAAKLVPPPQTYVLEFNQSSAFFPTSPLLDLSPNYTIEFWVMHENNAPGAFFGMEIPNTGDGIYRFDFAENGEITYGQGNGTPQSFAQITSPGALPNHAWAHIAATSDGTTVRLYVDGVDVIDMQSPGTPQNVESIPLQFGIGGNYLYAMRQLRFWNIALTPEQIAAYSTTRLSGGEIGLVADWPFDDGTASMARDVGRHHLDLPLPGIIGYAPPVPAIRWVHSAVLDAGPFFLEEGPFAATSLNGTQLNMGAGTLTDFNHDGALDAIVSTYVNDPNVATPLVALRNDGNGHLSDATPETFSGAVPTLYGVETFASGDFDGDGKTDLFVAANGEGRTPNWGAQSHLLLQTPTGQLNDVTSTNLPQLDAYTPLAYAADIDGSGHLDIFMGNIHFGQILSPVGPLFLDNDGAGRFSLDQSRLPSDFLGPSAHWPTAVLVDARHKPVPDIIACCKTDFHPDSLLLNDGHGHFVEAPDGAMPPIGDLFEPNATATGDFDGDGWDDLIEEWCPTTNPNDGGCSLRLSLNNRNGTFRDATGGVPQAGNYVLEHAELGGTYGLHAADLNGDGLPDILLNSGQLFLNVGGARFIDATELLPFNFAGQLLPGDLDGNGSIDILSPGGASFVVLRQLKAVSVDLFNPVERIHRHLRHASQ